MSAMSQQIDPDKNYTTGEVGKLTGLTNRHIVRLVDNGQFPGSFRKSPVPHSPRMVPGAAIIAFLEQRKLD